MTEANPEPSEVSHGVTNVVPDGYFTMAQASSRVGRSQDTLKRWRRTGVFHPVHFTRAGKLKIWLYTHEDIQKMRELTTTIRPGRVAKETQEDGG